MKLSGLLLVIALTIVHSGLSTENVSSPEEHCNLGGPVSNPGMNVVVDSQGVQAPGYLFVNQCAKPDPWQAKWIWTTEDKKNQGFFRKKLILDKMPAKASAWISADKKYRLWVNGRLVSRGPADIGRDFAGGSTERWFYDFRDLTPFFHKGENLIAAEVDGSGIPGGPVSRGKPGFLFEALIDGKRVTSDSSWQAICGSGSTGWQQLPGNDAAWSPASEIKDLWSPLVASEIPPLMEALYPATRIEGLPVGKTFTKDGVFRVVFDRVLSGFPQIRVKGGQWASVTIKAKHGSEFMLSGAEETLESPFMTEIAPSYTVEIRNVKSPVEILDAGAVFTSQPLEYRGSFECSDAGLNKIWKASRWAVQICLQTHHLDSPNHQEPISDPGDYEIESMVNYYAFAQPWLARQDIRKFAWILRNENYHNFHTSYSIAWLQMLMDYYDYTGDGAFVEELAPTVYGLLDTYTSWRGKNGLISEAPNYMFMDWVKIAGIPCHHPPAVIGQGYLTALYYHGLEMGAKIAALQGNKELEKKYAELRSQVLRAFNQELWVPEKGLYRDGKPFQTSVAPSKWLPADTQIESFSPHVNMLAVLYDLEPEERQAAIVEKVLSEKPLNVQPWFMHKIFAALDHAGLFDKYGTELMRRWQINPETQSFREMWDHGDLSHGWCSTPLVQMSGRVLGVTPTSPGFRTMAIRPSPSDLKWAKGVVPTPHGDVRVTWTNESGILSLDVVIPEGTEADLLLSGRREHVTQGKHHIESKTTGENQKLRE